jgi:nitrous oxide reductase accessory protein NosL
MRRCRFFTLVALVAVLVVACGKRGNWPEGMEPIHWDRDTCAQCNMAISDPRFAVELRQGPKNTAYKFDDIGCLIVWTNAQARKTGTPPWWEGTDARVWIADFGSMTANRETLLWLDARIARYIERSSPMGYNLAAVESSSERSIGFDGIVRFGQAHRHDDEHDGHGGHSGHEGDHR